MVNMSAHFGGWWLAGVDGGVVHGSQAHGKRFILKEDYDARARKWVPMPTFVALHATTTTSDRLTGHSKAYARAQGPVANIQIVS